MQASERVASDTKTLSEQAHDLIRRDILNGELFPGDKLQIEAISERYHIGIAPVREAHHDQRMSPGGGYGSGLVWRLWRRKYPGIEREDA